MESLFDSVDGGETDPDGGDGGPSNVVVRLHQTPSSIESRRAWPADSPWQECPLDAFLAMPEREQLDYCARRDEDSARFALTEQDALWYLGRAAMYRRMIEELAR